jgi:hypothetical protein
MIGPKILSRSILVGTGLLVVGLSLTSLRNRAGAEVAATESGPRPAKTDVETIRRVGSDSCVARGCHGAVGTADPIKDRPYYSHGGEATTWRSFDPHSRAYDVLLNARSVGIAKRLKADLKGKPAHLAKLCLDCHSIGGEPSPDGGNVRAFASGVDCETCHGPASAWLEPHLSKSWPERTDKATLGFRPLLDLTDRAKFCVSCHVGDPSKQVNHDLIAAGHPRLIFELDAYLTSLPRHWREPHEKPGAKTGAGDFHARAWAIGQVETTGATLDLLKSRADAASHGDAPWPEFTEYDCFACHHELAKPSWRQSDPGRKTPGALPWGAWNVPTTAALIGPEGATSLFALQTEMARPMPDPARVSQLADTAAKSLPRGKSIPITAERAVALLRGFLETEKTPRSWDEAAARSLAAGSLAEAVKDLTGRPVDPALSDRAAALRRRLDFPPPFDSPKGFHP